MTRRASRGLILWIAIYLMIGIAGLVVCELLDSFLSSYTHHDRRLWEGGVCALIIWAGLEIEYLARKAARGLR